jgi:hypothetical protein
MISLAACKQFKCRDRVFIGRDEVLALRRPVALSHAILWTGQGHLAVAINVYRLSVTSRLAGDIRYAVFLLVKGISRVNT